MKRVQTITVFFSILIIIFSCNKMNEETKSSFREFPNNVNMSERLLDEFNLEACYDPSNINIYDSLLIITQDRMKNGIFSIYSLKTHELLAGFGKQGKGPDEFINAGYPQIDKIHGLLWFIDYPKTTFYAYRIKDVLENFDNLKPVKKIKFDQSLMPIFNYVILEDTSIMIPASSHSDLCTIINTNGNVINVLGSQPMFDSDGLPQQAYSDLHARTIVLNSEKNEIVFSYVYYDKLLKYNIKTNEIFIVTGHDKIKQKAQAMEDGFLFKPITIIKGYFYAIKNTKEKIYALYLGGRQFNDDISVNRPHNIHVFNWNLEPLINLQFDKGVRAFDINESGTVLYVLTDQDEKNFRVYSLEFFF